ncbi:FAD-binding oxidoreductase [Sphingopyxis panaciterrae]
MTARLIELLAANLGADGTIVAPPADFDRHLQDALVAVPDGVELLGVVYPRSTAAVAAILKTASAAGITVVPQGGLSGLAGGAVPLAPALIVSLEKMATIVEVDGDAMAMVVDAGVTLEAVQQAADAAGYLFPLDLGARGSAQVGGLISTNAGGNRVLRYGMMRDLVLGLEVVLADGTVLTMLDKMLKNNSGYDLKQLFIGAEGTLGIVTRAVLKLAAKPAASTTLLCAVANYDAALTLLARLRTRFAAELTAFEVMWPDFYGEATAGRAPPLAHGHGLYILAEAFWQQPPDNADPFVELVMTAIADGIVGDAVAASSLREAAALWAIRDASGEVYRTTRMPAIFDVSLASGQIGAFVDAHRAAFMARWPNIRLAYFGHAADGNLHISIALDEHSGGEDELDRLTYEMIGQWQGAVSAEHGIGFHKRPYLHHSRSAEQLATMRAVKSALDPHGLINPGKIF